MKNIFKKAVVVLLIATMAFMAIGCYGSFNLTKKVYNWNGSLGNKWVTELVFLGLNVVPVYGIAGAIDVYILNLIEFWTGKNPMAANITTEEGINVAFNEQTKEVTVTYADKKFTVAMVDGKATVKNANGEAIAYAESTEDGGMVIKDMSGKVFSKDSKEQVAALFAGK
jgi:hypothetical protein